MFEISELANFLLKLRMVKGIGPVRFMGLVEVYGGVDRLVDAYKNDLLEPKLADSVQAIDIKDIIHNLAKFSVSIVAYGEEGYPLGFMNLADPPMLLFYKGNIRNLANIPLVSVVGTRQINRVTERLTREVVSDLVSSGVGVVSGMAFGIDTVAHQAAIDSGGFTAAILPGGVESPIPSGNWEIYEQILANGGVIMSEFPPGQTLTKGMFAHRNRLVAGISQATLVTSAGRQSGSLITAECAFDYGRQVFALPGNVGNPDFAGCNYLIKSEKAKLVESAGDVLTDLGQGVNWESGLTFKVHRQQNSQKQSLTELVNQKLAKLDPIQRQVYEVINKGPLAVEEVMVLVDKSLPDALSLLMSLEMLNLVTRTEDGKYSV